MLKHYVYILALILLLSPTAPYAKKLNLAEVKAKLTKIKSNSPHTLCIKQHKVESCVDLIIGNDKDIYFNEITKNLNLQKQMALSNYLIEYVLKDKEILTDERLTNNEKNSLHALHFERNEYGLVERIPKRLLDKVYSLNLKSSNFFKYISTPKYHRKSTFLIKSAMQKDNTENEVFGTLIAKTYYKNRVNNISSLPVFFDKVLSMCTLCDRREYISKFHKLPGYGKNIVAGLPRTSIEYKYIFKPSISAGWVNKSLSNRYQKLLVTNVSEIPYFIDSVLSTCSNCDKPSTYRNLVKTNGFGSKARNFFESIEYNYVLKHFPYHEIVEKYFDYAVSFESDLPKFFNTVLAKCQQRCDSQAYYKKILQLPKLNLNLDIEKFRNRLIYQYVVKHLPYNISAYSSENTFSLRLSAGGQSFRTSFSGICEYNYATSSRDSASFFQAMRGASEAINHYDVYSCKLPQTAINRIEKFTQVMNSQSDFNKIVSRTHWSRSEFKYATLIYPEPSQIGTNSYSDAPSRSSSSTSTASSSNTSNSTSKSPTNKREIKRIVSNGRVSNVPSFRVECTGGSDHVIYHKNGTWYHGFLGKMGNKFNTWNKERVGAYLCK
ncbi:MAG: hypothetical protein V7736_08650 [Colwellia polaris]|jgi:hypothetical protein|uniref:hypothetical protein n=1 Tax=Colwellia polaris TaxID=326537 RepID=UPI000A174794|nr:hypothetical protein [Colwellia polaris]|tara:strand:- start:17319 stop:19136 length:1818 start_codon:yes stop_codon:yes gene_type:complete